MNNLSFEYICNIIFVGEMEIKLRRLQKKDEIPFIFYFLCNIKLKSWLDSFWCLIFCGIWPQWMLSNMAQSSTYWFYYESLYGLHWTLEFRLQRHSFLNKENRSGIQTAKLHRNTSSRTFLELQVYFWHWTKVKKI